MDEVAQQQSEADPVVQKHGAGERAPKDRKSAFQSPGRVAAWLATLIVCVVGLAGIVQFTLDRLRADFLLNASATEARERLVEIWPDSASADYYEVLSELSQVHQPADLEMAYLAAQRAVIADEARPYAWARLAYYATERAGGVNEETIRALAKSMTYCPLCSQDLVRWRMNFVLSHWIDMPDVLRRKAFEHGDMLRWNGSNAEFLAEMRVKSRNLGIPFDEYRSEVNTPVRSWDIAPLGDATAQLDYLSR